MTVPKIRRPKIYPVIHYIDPPTALAEAEKANAAGADGIFLISHRNDDIDLLSVACAIRRLYSAMPIGLNLLSMEGLAAMQMVQEFGFPMMWADDAGVDSTGVHEMGAAIQKVQSESGASRIEVFASVAFKYRPCEPHPALAARVALDAGFIPTTSGSGTGSAPEVGKIKAMSSATGGVLAVASGMTPDNVGLYAPYLSHILVATGVAQDEHRMDVEKLSQLIRNSEYNRERVGAE